jgi:6-pyruvoyltetrahydropterin/6-carboxytetrahydropterin synthase
MRNAHIDARSLPENKMELFKEFSFEAAHAIPPYSGLHGHSFSVRVVLRGSPDPVYGWATSLTDIEPHVEAVRRELDHKCLNNIEGLAMPSLENIAQWIWRRLANTVPGLDRIIVRRGSSGHGEGCTYRGHAG